MRLPTWVVSIRSVLRFIAILRLLFGGFFVMTAKLHLAEDALALHLLFQRLQGLVDVVVTDENLHAAFLMLPICLMYGSPPIATEARSRGLSMAWACSRISAKS